MSNTPNASDRLITSSGLAYTAAVTSAGSSITSVGSSNHVGSSITSLGPLVLITVVSSTGGGKLLVMRISGLDPEKLFEYQPLTRRYRTNCRDRKDGSK